MASEQLISAQITMLANVLGIPIFAFALLIAFVMIWSLIWKGLALWKSARLNQPIWFLFLLIINTLGILEILYIYIFSKSKMRKKHHLSIEKEVSKTSKRKRR